MTPPQYTNESKPRDRLLQCIKGSKEKHQQSKDTGQQVRGPESKQPAQA